MLTSRSPLPSGTPRPLMNGSMCTSNLPFYIRQLPVRGWCGRVIPRCRLCPSRRMCSGTRMRMPRSRIGSARVGVYTFEEFPNGCMHSNDGSTTAISKISAKPIHHLRDELTDTCAATLLGYRRNCAQSSVPSQVRCVEPAIAQFPDSASTATVAGYSGSVQGALDIHSRDEQE